MGHDNPFANVTSEQLGVIAKQHGYQRKGKRNWFRRTIDFVQLINLQKSQYSSGNYLNFALWPHALGEPPAMLEHKFLYRARAGQLGAGDLETFFSVADRLTTLSELCEAEESGRISGLIRVEMQPLLDRATSS